MNALKSILGAVAPALATALGGPLAGAAVGALSKKLLGKDNGSEDELIAAVQGASPEVMLQIKALDVEFKRALIDATVRVEAMEHDDRADARARDIKVRELRGGQNDRQNVMIIGATVGLLACLLTLAFFRKEVPGEVVGIISTVAGIFGACLKDAFQFEFGSSRGSKEANATIAKIAQSD